MNNPNFENTIRIRRLGRFRRADWALEVLCANGVWLEVETFYSLRAAINEAREWKHKDMSDVVTP